MVFRQALTWKGLFVTSPESRPRTFRPLCLKEMRAVLSVPSKAWISGAEAGVAGGLWPDMTGGRQDGRMKRRAQPRPEAREGTAPVVGAHTAEAACQVHRLLSLAISSLSDSPSSSPPKFVRLPTNFSA